MANAFDEFVHSEEIVDMSTRLYELRDKIQNAVLIYDFKTESDDEEPDTTIFISAGTGLLLANWMLDEAKNAIHNGYEVDEDEEDETQTNP
jgi:hypothetical protein